MASLTLRNIPEPALEKLRRLAVADRRSLNNEILVLLEQALGEVRPPAEGCPGRMSPATQVKHWENLCGGWRDDRSWDDIAADIVEHRSAGREVTL